MSDSFIIRRADGSERAISGYKFAAPAADYKVYGSDGGSDELPSKVDLRRYMTAVEDQGPINSCSANAVAGAYEYLVKRHLGDDSYDVSRLFIYYNGRAQGDDEIKDDGSVIAYCIKSLSEQGACSEETWPYNTEQVNEEPDEDSYDEGQDFLVEDVARVPTDLNAWKKCLAEGYPIIFGMRLYKSFDKHRRKGLVPMPTPSEASRESHGGHAMLCVGYSDKDKVFIVRNSWGTQWGDNGYCYIPYDYLINEKYNGGDSWLIRRVEDVEYDDELYADDDDSILEDIDSELANMSDEDYEAMLEDMGDFSLEYRLGLILLHAASADGELSDEEMAEISGYMTDTLDSLGIEMSARKILKNCAKHFEDEDLLDESVELFADYLSKSALAGILSDIESIIEVDDLSDEEDEFIESLVSVWQLGEDSDGDDEYDDDDDDDEYDE